ncbi:MAG: molybdopterin cofactor-binding domain-containing protein [Candidatus Acidiferrales bacterium]
MSEARIQTDALELERYELLAPSAYHFELDRREFFRVFGAGALVVSVARQALAQESGRGRRRREMPREINAWLHIGENGVVSVYTGKVEVGQQIRTSLTQAVAEELRYPMGKIKLVMADTQLTPFDAGTFGSRTTPIMNLQLRRVAAATRNLLLDLAAEKWQVAREQLQAANGEVTNGEPNQSVEYAELLRGREIAATVAADVALVPAGEWQVAGQPAARMDAVELINGVHRYPIDIKRPGMFYGKILRPAAFGATLVSVDTSAAEKLAGVTVVRDGEFIGVAAASAAEATRAAAAVRAEWKETPQPSHKEIFHYLKSNAGQPSERGSSEVGSVKDGFAAADHRLEQTYTVAYIAHTPLEPRAAVAEWDGDKLTVWTGTQRPFGVQGDLAEAFRVPEASVRVIVPDTGSAYGGKHSGETAVEAARLARAAQRPVMVAWTREEEFTWAYFRPAGVIEVKSGARKDGKITAWEFHNYNSGGSAIRPLYAIPHQRIQFHPVESPLRQGSYRGLAATANHFAREVHMDELAHLLKLDPLEFRLKNLEDARLRAVLQAAAKKFAWPRKKTKPGQGFGIAGGFEKGSYVACCAEVAVDRETREVRVARVVTAFECGAVVNPDGLRNQIEGAVVQGLGGALFEAIEFAKGRIANPRFSGYRVPRFSDVPALETVLVDRRDLPSAGAGETPIVGVAPAVGNAIFDASGVRLRALPMVPNGLEASERS